jgi:hypothetical protein
MKTKGIIKAALWMVPGTAVMLVLVVTAAHFGSQGGPAAALAARARRADLASRLQLGLSSASEAEKTAVMAVTDQDSKAYADLARAATGDVARERDELDAMLRTSGTPRERELLEQFSQSFVEFQRIDGELLALAVKNTNLKAYSLAFGPAAQAVQEMNDALSKLAAENAGAPDATRIVQLAFSAQTSALRIQTLLAPHIAEESDAQMDKLEASMAKEDGRVRSSLDGLGALSRLRTNADLATATLSYTRFTGLRTDILALSRENTNVRSLTISLNQKRKVATVCQDALTALKQAILDEPARGGPPVSPR